MQLFLAVSQMVISVALVALILLQRRGTGLSAVFGGEGGSWYARRGLEKFVFWLTILFAFLFVATSLTSLLVAA